MRITILLLVALMSPGGARAPADPIHLIETIALGGVEGRIDHMALDQTGQRLFVAALGNGTVEVVDLRSGRRVRSLGGFREPQGLGYGSSPPRLFVANGGDGTCEILEGESYKHLRTLRFSGDADNVVCDARDRRVYVGYGEGGLRVFDAANGDSLGDIPLTAHPEAFAVESAGSRVFVNVPEVGEVAVADRSAGRVMGRWRVSGFSANFPMALDEAGHRLFVGYRRPGAVVVLDTRSGARRSVIPIDGDVDDLFFDVAGQRLFAVCGAGFIDVIAAGGSRSFRRIGRTATAPGARTALFAPASRRLYVAVPHRGAQQAEIRVFEVAPEKG